MKPRIYLVDAHAFLHRAYHALPPLTNPRGEPVGALYGFARMLMQLLKKEKPSAVAVCFDSAGPTFRHKAYADYKATRKEIDPDLVAQLKRSRELIESLGFACFEEPGFEADDLMATLAKRSLDEGYEAVMVTGDKDALQLVGAGIRVLKDVGNGTWMDPPQIEQKFGVPPERIIDYLAIVGDAVDNVPGIRGIGPVGAQKLLKQYGSLKALIKAAKSKDSHIPPKTAKVIAESEKEALASFSLIRLAENVPIKIRPSECRVPDLGSAAAAEVLTRWGFKSLSQASSRPNGESAVQPSLISAGAESQGIVWNEKSFDTLSEALGKGPILLACCAAAAEKGGVAVRHMALATADGKACFFDEGEIKRRRKTLALILSGEALKAAYDLKDCMTVLEPLDLEIKGPLFDVRLAAYCLNPVRPRLVLPDDWRGALGELLRQASDYEEWRRRLKSGGVLSLYQDLELPLVVVLRGMEREGIVLDEAYLKKLESEFNRDIAALKSEIDALAGLPINVNSPKQLGELLYDKMGLPVVHKTAKGGRSTDEECLRILSRSHPIAQKILEYRELSKLKSTYIDGLLERLNPETGRVHTRFDQAGAETGRLASLNPNLQNIPIRSPAGLKIRRAFIASKGTLFVSADYSQIDLRVLAHVSADEVLRESFSRNEDVHLRTACEVFHVDPHKVDAEMRRRAKAVNFGIVYGQTAFGLAAQLGIPQKEAADIIARYFKRYAGVARWIEGNLAEARREGLARTFLGRVRRLPELSAKNTAVRQFAERAARNTPIQGGSADIIKAAMLKVAEGLEKKEFKARMLLQIHDELLFEVERRDVGAFVPWVSRVMEGAVKLSVPLIVDVRVGANWRDMEDFKP